MNSRAKASAEKPIQIKVSAKLKRAIQKQAFECEETVRAFVLRALKERGVPISEADLVDRRKGPTR